MQFSTYDVDNDEDGGNCATSSGNGGNWYSNCHGQNLNGKNGERGDEFMHWFMFDTSNPWMSLKSMRWMVREVV